MSTRVLLLGDSHLARVQRDLSRLGPSVRNAAVGGSIAAQVVDQARRAGLGPDDVAVVSIGTNDAFARSGVSPTAFRAELGSLIAGFAPRRWVYVASPGVRAARPEDVEAGLAARLASYSAVATELFIAADGRAIDTPTVVRDLGGRAFTADGVHLTGAAYDRLLPAIADELG